MNIGPGSILGGYRIERALGSGGMGTVYLAAHPALPRHDAIKVLWPHMAADPEFRARFEREANLAATLDHPNIVAVHNRGEDEGCLWIALQYVAGTDAATAQNQDPASMPLMRVLHIITEIGKALDHAHHHGMLHRDVKPANFLLSPQPHGPERVLLADFGIAKPTDGSTELTRTGAFMATVAFASPEQLSAGKLDSRSDQYSLACSFYRLLMGQNPYPGTEALNVMLAHLNEPPPRISALRPELPAGLDGVLARALAKDPSQRFASCFEFATAAMQALSSTPSRTAPTVRVSPPAQPRDVVPGARPFPDLVPNIDAPARPASLPAMPPEPKPLRHEIKRVRSRKVMAWIIALALIISAVVALAINNGRRSSGNSAAPTASRPAVVASTSLVTTTSKIAGLQNPCDLLKEGFSTSPSRFGLKPAGLLDDLYDTRSCTWGPLRAGDPSAFVYIVANKTQYADARPYRLANEVNAEESRGTTGGGADFQSCRISWPTSFGHVEVSRGASNAAFGIEILCQQARDLAESIYTGDNPTLQR